MNIVVPSRKQSSITCSSTKRRGRGSIFPSHHLGSGIFTYQFNFLCLGIMKLIYPFPRHTVIRAPVPWHQSFVLSSQFCRHNLFITHPILIRIQVKYGFLPRPFLSYLKAHFRWYGSRNSITWSLFRYQAWVLMGVTWMLPPVRKKCRVEYLTNVLGRGQF